MPSNDSPCNSNKKKCCPDEKNRQESVSIWTIAWGIVIAFIIILILAWLLAILTAWLFGDSVTSRLGGAMKPHIVYVNQQPGVARM